MWARTGAVQATSAWSALSQGSQGALGCTAVDSLAGAVDGLAEGGSHAAHIDNGASVQQHDIAAGTSFANQHSARTRVADSSALLAFGALISQ